MLFFFKQKTAYEITYGDWSSDVCSSDLMPAGIIHQYYWEAKAGVIGRVDRRLSSVWKGVARSNPTRKLIDDAL